MPVLLRPFITFLTCLLFSLVVKAQIYVPCAMNAGPQEQLYDLSNYMSFSEHSIDPSQRILSIHLHIVADTGYNYLPDTVTFMGVLDDLNELFSPSGISFKYCQIDTIPNYKYNNFSVETEWDELKTLYYHAGVINLFLVHDIVYSHNNDPLEGHTNFPGGDDIIVLTRAAFLQQGLAHQLGHFLGLYHTYENAFGIDTLNSLNCDSVGDLCCDTNQDYVIEANASCDPVLLIEYNGNKYYHPIDNIMSSHQACRCIFTIQQFNRMIYTLHTRRSYLK